MFSKHYKNLSYTLFKDGSQCGLINENGEIYAVDNAKPLKPFHSLPLLLISEQNELLCLDPRKQIGNANHELFKERCTFKLS